MFGGVLDPELRRRAVAEVMSALQRVLRADLHGAILKGSALKGDFFPYWSDLDVHAFVGAGAMAGPRAVRPEAALALQRALGGFDAAAYTLGSLQLYCLRSDAYPPDWVKPLPGTYELVAGRLPHGFLDVVDPERYREKAVETLVAATKFLRSRAENLIDKPDRDLPAVVRRIGIDMKCLAYTVPIVHGADPADVWRWRLRRALDAAEAIAFPSRSLSAFFALIDPWPADIERCRRMLHFAFASAAESPATV